MHPTVRCRIIVVSDLALRHYYAHSHELLNIARGGINGGVELLEFLVKLKVHSASDDAVLITQSQNVRARCIFIAQISAP